MILTFKLRHDIDVKEKLRLAKGVAEYAVRNKVRLPNSKDVADIRGELPSTICCGVMKKYGNQKTIKEVHRVNLVVPGQGVKYDPETNSIWISCLKMHLENTIPYAFSKINQVEVTKEYAFVSVTISEEPGMMPQQYIGVDRNTTGHIAVAANPDTGKVLKLGKTALYVHKKYKNIRTRLQKNKKFRQVKLLKDRESRIVRDLNHKISRKLVDVAKAQNAALVFEDLSGIRNTKKQAKSFKYSLHSWSFYQLQTFVAYKAKLLGVPVVYVDPAYTSQDCSVCGARGKRDGKTFKCPHCGHVDHADANAAFNIALRQKTMVNWYQTEMVSRGALIPPKRSVPCAIAMRTTLEPPML